MSAQDGVQARSAMMFRKYGVGPNPAISLTTYSGPGGVTKFTTTSADQIVENLRITGGIDYAHPRPIFRNCRIEGRTHNISAGEFPTFYQCLFAPNDGSWFYPDGSVKGDGVASDHAIGYWGLRVDRCEIYGFGDGIKCGNDSVIYRNWIHDLYAYSQGGGFYNHVDGVQMLGGGRSRVIGNIIDPRYWKEVSEGGVKVFTNSATAAVIIKADIAAIDSAVIAYNVMQGATGFTIYVVDTHNGDDTIKFPISNIKVHNNRFKDNIYTNGSQFGFAQVTMDSHNVGLQWYENRRYRNRALINLPGSSNSEVMRIG